MVFKFFRSWLRAERPFGTHRIQQSSPKKERLIVFTLFRSQHESLEQVAGLDTAKGTSLGRRSCLCMLLKKCGVPVCALGPNFEGHKHISNQGKLTGLPHLRGLSDDRQDAKKQNKNCRTTSTTFVSAAHGQTSQKIFGKEHCAANEGYHALNSMRKRIAEVGFDPDARTWRELADMKLAETEWRSQTYTKMKPMFLTCIKK